MNDHPSSSPRATATPRSSRWSLLAASRAMPTPATKPATPIAMSARLRLLIQDPAEGLTGKLALGDEAACAAALDQRPEVRCVVTRRQDDRGRGAVDQQALGDVEALGVGQVHVEEDEIGAPGAGSLKRLGARAGLGDDLEPVRLEHPARACAEALVVVDDQHLHAAKSRRLRGFSPYG